MLDGGLARDAFLKVSAILGARAIAPVHCGLTGPISTDHPNRVSRTLVVSIGGARGAYEGGMIDYLVQAGEIKDGEPLAPCGFLCGTSIRPLKNTYSQRDSAAMCNSQLDG